MKHTMVIAEMSANHNRDLSRALEIVQAAKSAGADAVKLQCYTADSISMHGTPQHEVYRRAATPRELIPDIVDSILGLGMKAIPTPYSMDDVNGLVFNWPGYGARGEYIKVSSFDLINHRLLRSVADTDATLLISTGMASWGEINKAMRLCELGRGGHRHRDEQVWLHCVSGYPSSPDETNLANMRELSSEGVYRVGISDHSKDEDVLCAAVASGAEVVEVHLDLEDRCGLDAEFSYTPSRLAHAVRRIRGFEEIMGTTDRELKESERRHYGARPGLWFARDVPEGARIGSDDIIVRRPRGNILASSEGQVVGRNALRQCNAGQPVSWDDIGGIKGGK